MMTLFISGLLIQSFFRVIEHLFLVYDSIWLADLDAFQETAESSK